MAATEAIGPYELLARRVPGGLRVCKGLQAGERLAVSMHSFSPSERDQFTATYFRPHIVQLRKLSHPHLFTFVDAVLQRSAVGVVFSPLPTLYLMKRAYQGSAHKPSLSETRNLFRQIAFAIAHAHRQGVAHGALSHHHLLLSSPDHAVIQGMGLHGFPALDTCIPTPVFDVLEPWETYYNFTPPEGFTPLDCQLDEAVVVDGRALFRRRVAADMWCLGALLFALTKGHNYSPGTEDLDCALDFASPDEVKHLIHGLLQRDPAQRISINHVLEHPWFLAEDADTIRRAQHDLLDANELLDIPEYLLEAHRSPVLTSVAGGDDQAPASPIESHLSGGGFASPRSKKALRRQDMSVVFTGPEKDVLSLLVSKTDAHVFAVIGVTSEYECMCVTSDGSLLHFKIQFGPMDGPQEPAAALLGMDSLNSLKLYSRATFSAIRGKDSELAGVVDAVRRSVGSAASDMLSPTSGRNQHPLP